MIFIYGKLRSTFMPTERDLLNTILVHDIFDTIQFWWRFEIVSNNNKIDKSPNPRVESIWLPPHDLLPIPDTFCRSQVSSANQTSKCNFLWVGFFPGIYTTKINPKWHESLIDDFIGVIQTLHMFLNHILMFANFMYLNQI